MTTATITTKCPVEWCKLQGWPNGHSGPDPEGGHSGPAWPEVLTNIPRFTSGGFTGVSVSTGSNEAEAMIVFLEAPNAQLTPEQALEAGRYLIEAGTWALAHLVA